MRIFLIGLMASGKSVYGKELSELMNYPFIDLDILTEEISGKTITELFNVKGEDYFRLLEKETLRGIKDVDVVVSTGGGTPAFYGNMEFMNETGVSIFLNTPLNIVYQRLKNKKSARPLIMNSPDEELMSIISNIFFQRKNFYREANFIINPVLLPPANIIRYLQNEKRNPD